MRTDSRGRRLRFERAPKDELIVLSDRDLAVFEAIHRHGLLPSNYLFEFVRSHYRSDLHFKHRLTKLYHGLLDGTYFLERPPQQYRSFLARAQESIYDLAPAGRIALAEAGRLSPYVGQRSDHFLHQYMAACISASIELTAQRNGLRFIHRHEIFSHEKCPLETKRSRNPLLLPSGRTHLIPDDLFGLDYGGKFRFFALEVDRNTESLTRNNLDQTSFGRKLKAYTEVLDTGTFRDVWGVPALLILIVTTNAVHMQNMMKYLVNLDQPRHGSFLFRSKAEFGQNWTIPPTMHDLLHTPWARTSGPFIISAP